VCKSEQISVCDIYNLRTTPSSGGKSTRDSFRHSVLNVSKSRKIELLIFADRAGREALLPFCLSAYLLFDFDLFRKWWSPFVILELSRYMFRWIGSLHGKEQCYLLHLSRACSHSATPRLQFNRFCTRNPGRASYGLVVERERLQKPSTYDTMVGH